MKVIQLGNVNDGNCFFVQLGGHELLLDCGVDLQPHVQSSSLGRKPHRIRLPALHTIDVRSLDFVLVSNAFNILALPFLTERLGFRGQVYATQPTIEYGRYLLHELASSSSSSSSSTGCLEYEYAHVDANQKLSEVFAPFGTTLEPLTRFEIEQSLQKLVFVEYKEVVSLAYGMKITALSSGFSFGSCMWLLDNGHERFAYVTAACGDYLRYPKELDFAPLYGCDTLLLTDLRPDRDPMRTTERLLEKLHNDVSRIISRNGVCLIPLAFASCSLALLVDLIENIYTSCVHLLSTQVSIYVVADFAEDLLLESSQMTPEWLSDKKVEHQFASECFLLTRLLRDKKLSGVSVVSPAMASTIQSGSSIVFTFGHPCLPFGQTQQLLDLFGSNPQNGVVMIDPSLRAYDVLRQVKDLDVAFCPIDPRLTCGEANQLIARCAPHQLIAPSEFFINEPGQVPHEAPEHSHLTRVLSLKELIASKGKAELMTFSMTYLEPIVIDRTSKYVDGHLQLQLAARTRLTEVSGKGAGFISGVLAMRNNTFVLEAPEPLTDPQSSVTGEEKALTNGKKRTISSISALSPTNLSLSLSATSTSPTNTTNCLAVKVQRLDYREKTVVLLGSVDEEKLLKQLRAHDAQAAVFVSENNGEVVISIPSLEAKVFLSKSDDRTIIETTTETSRVLLTSWILAQLAVVG